jgi:hypothetical protein
MAIRIVLDEISALAYLLQGRFLFFTAVFRAHLAFCYHIPSLIKRRKNCNQTARLEQLPGMYHSSIVIDYFLRKNKTFSSLRFKD